MKDLLAKIKKIGMKIDPDVKEYIDLLFSTNIDIPATDPYPAYYLANVFKLEADSQKTAYLSFEDEETAVLRQLEGDDLPAPDKWRFIPQKIDQSECVIINDTYSTPGRLLYLSRNDANNLILLDANPTIWDCDLISAPNSHLEIYNSNDALAWVVDGTDRVAVNRRSDIVDYRKRKWKYAMTTGGSKT